MERRSFEIQADTNPLIIKGHAINFGEIARVGYFLEVIQSGALDGIVFDSIPLLYNHSTELLPLAKYPDTMTLEITSSGLDFLAVLPDTATGNEVFEAVKRRDLCGVSFGFDVGTDYFDLNTNTRVITKIEHLYELSLTPFPVYLGSTVETRSRITAAKERAIAKKDARILLNNILIRGGMID